MNRDNKHVLQSMAAALLTCMAFASCNTEDMPDSNIPLPDGQYPLMLSAEVEGMRSRAAGKDAWDDGDAIGVRIGENGEPGQYKLTQGGDIQEAVKPLYWQNTSSSTVTAWYPCEEKTEVNIADQSGGYADFDFLTATETNQRYNNPVSLKFKHQMAKVKYVLLQGEGIADEDFTSATVSISGYTSANFSRGVLSGSGDGWITPTADKEALLVPQDMTDRHFIKVSIGKTDDEKRDFFYTPDGNAGKLQSGVSYTYTITVTRTGLNVTVSALWEGGNSIEGDGTPVPVESYYLTLPVELNNVEVKDAEGNLLKPEENGSYALPATHKGFSVSYPTDDAMKSLVPVSGLCKVKSRTGTEQASLTYTSEYDQVFSDVELLMETYAHPGDYYYSDGTWAPYLKSDASVTIIGVVFHSGVGLGDNVANYSAKGLTEIHGYAVALKDMLNKQPTAWGGKLPRIEVNNKEELQDFDIPEITNYDRISYNGFEVTQIIRNLYMPYTELYEFPAFAALDTYDEEVAHAPATSSGWYMPSVAMCGAIHAVRKTIASCPDGTAPSAAYLTTCENDAAGVTGYYFNGDKGENTGRDKNDCSGRARAVLTF